MSAAARWQTWRDPLIAFLVGQPAIQALNLVIGFFVIRWLSVTAYAQFGVAFAFQSTISQLVDLGFPASIVALVGERGANRQVVGEYVSAARYFRRELLMVVSCLAAIAFPAVVWRQPWGAETKGLLFGAIVLAVCFQGFAVYASPLLIHRRLRVYYQPQIVGGFLRLVGTALLAAAGALTSWTAALVNALAIGFIGTKLRSTAKPLIDEPVSSDPAVRAEMRRYLAPLIPGIVFTALQGQILVALITLRGASRSIAEVSALGRIGQIFLALGSFNSVIIEPYMARLPASMLRLRYMQILGAAIVITGLISAMGFSFPHALLWVLGPKYSGLGPEVGWVVVSACIGYLSGVLWAMHTARKWIFWWGTAAYIATIIIVQTACVATLDLSRTQDVIFFGVFTSLAVLAVHIATGVYGLWKSSHHGSPSH